MTSSIYPSPWLDASQECCIAKVHYNLATLSSLLERIGGNFTIRDNDVERIGALIEAKENGELVVSCSPFSFIISLHTKFTIRSFS